jgi:hypothetical protein
LLMWLEYNLLQESTATICLALYTSWLSNHLWTIWVTLETGSIRPNLFPVLASSSPQFCQSAQQRWCHALELSWASSWSHIIKGHCFHLFFCNNHQTSLC